MLHRIVYLPHLNRDDDLVEADEVTVEGGGTHVVLRRSVLVAGMPRSVVVRRVVGLDVLMVELDQGSAAL